MDYANAKQELITHQIRVLVVVEDAKNVPMVQFAKHVVQKIIIPSMILNVSAMNLIMLQTMERTAHVPKDIMINKMYACNVLEDAKLVKIPHYVLIVYSQYLL